MEEVEEEEGVRDCQNWQSFHGLASEGVLRWPAIAMDSPEF